MTVFLASKPESATQDYAPPVVDATDSLDAIASQFFRFDCVQVKNLLSPRRLAFFRKLAEQIYAQDDERFAGGEQDPVWRRQYENGWIWHDRLTKATDGAFSLQDIPACRRLYQILDRLMGPSWHPIDASQIRRMAPDLRTENWGSATNHHFDAQWGDADDTYCINVWTPLTHAGRKASALEFLLSKPHDLLDYAKYDPSIPREPRGPGGINPRFDYDRIGNAKLHEHFKPEQFWFPVSEPGDVVIFSHWAPHGTRAEKSMTDIRISLEWRVRIMEFDTKLRPQRKG